MNTAFAVAAAIMSVISACGADESLVLGNELDMRNAETIQFSGTNSLGDVEIRLKLPRKDAILLVKVARKNADERLKGQFDAFLEAQPAMSLSSADSLIASEEFRSVDKSKADFTIDRLFSGKRETRQVYIRMPAHDAYGFLKAAFTVGDENIKYQIMKFGFTKFSDEEVRADVINYLSASFDREGPVVRGDILVSMFAIAPRSPQTKEIIRKAMAITGDDKVSQLIRQMAADLNTYLLTGDKNILEKYKVAL